MKRERKMALPYIYIYPIDDVILLLLAGSKKRHSSLWRREARGSITPRALHSCECLTPFAITRLRNYRILSLYSNCSSLSLINPERDFITADVHHHYVRIIIVLQLDFSYYYSYRKRIIITRRTNKKRKKIFNEL